MCILLIVLDSRILQLHMGEIVPTAVFDKTVNKLKLMLQPW